ncbi:MAG: histidinol dehydrogenase [Solirubrobacteraceae bacterium]|nr:histidinol dehydrogenase [Solirubrobacteraceae bacterium]
MRVESLEGRAAGHALRALIPSGASVRDDVAEIVEAVRTGGDEVVAEYVQRFEDHAGPLRVPAEDLAAAAAAVDADVRAGLELAMTNVAAVAAASLGDDAEVELPQGQHVVVREFPVRRAAIYVPGGRNPYPSTVVMGVVTARVAGVEEIVVCAPGAHAVILAACALCGVSEVYAMGGAQAVAALAFGTETIPRVDVIAGPGSLYVQEAKRLVFGEVGIDGFLGPSDLVVVASGDADLELVALDLLAQAEHGDGTVVAVVSDDARALGVVEQRLAKGAETGAVAAVVLVDDLDAALAVAEAFAPEHLSLQGAAAEALAPQVRNAGCVFVGAGSAVAFGDYVAGSNHSLPTGGAARFGSALSPRAFRRRMAEVRVGGAAAALAGPGAAVARAEGFLVHAESMEARVRENGAP